jgi:hypothetical protein
MAARYEIRVAIEEGGVSLRRQSQARTFEHSGRSRAVPPRGKAVTRTVAPCRAAIGDTKASSRPKPSVTAGRRTG